MNGVIHTSKVLAARTGHMYSVVATEDIHNGSIGYLGELKEGETEVREFLKPTAELMADGELVFITTPELIYDQSKKSSGALGKFINVADLAMVGCPKNLGDEFEVSANMITALANKPVAGNYLVVEANSYKLKEVNAKPESPVNFLAKINYIKPSGVATYMGNDGKLQGNVYDLVHFTILK